MQAPRSVAGAEAAIAAGTFSHLEGGRTNPSLSPYPSPSLALALALPQALYLTLNHLKGGLQPLMGCTALRELDLSDNQVEFVHALTLPNPIALTQYSPSPNPNLNPKRQHPSLQPYNPDR